MESFAEEDWDELPCNAAVQPGAKNRAENGTACLG